MNPATPNRDNDPVFGPQIAQERSGAQIHDGAGDRPGAATLAYRAAASGLVGPAPIERRTGRALVQLARQALGALVIAAVDRAVLRG